MHISEIDSNLKVNSVIANPHLKYFDAASYPFSVYGVMTPTTEENYWRRMPSASAKSVSEGVGILATHTAGGRIRFRTDSAFVAVKAVFPEIARFNHMTATGISGFSLYIEDEASPERYLGSYIPGDSTEYEGIISLPDDGIMRSVTLYMPLYCGVVSLYIGLSDEADVDEAVPYPHSNPVVFYGSSITQGGCASRPGTDYEGFLSRALGFDFVNLGFSGCARGEQAMAEYIAGLKMSVFVMDYDHNSGPDELLERHEGFFRRVRVAQPDLPVIFITRPQQRLCPDTLRCYNAIRKTYDNALKAGDKNVRFIDGTTFFKDLPANDATVDSCHPTDLGFWLMAKGIEPVLKELL